jgi:hypothetical protein
MNLTILPHKLQELYYRFGGVSFAVGVCHQNPELIQSSNGEMYKTWLIRRNPTFLEKYPLYLCPDAFIKKSGQTFETGKEVVVFGALYKDYGLVYDIFNP